VVDSTGKSNILMEKYYIDNKINHIIMSDVSKTTINLPSDLKKELKIMAIREDTSLSGLILKMINEGYEARKNKNSDEDII